MTIYYLDPQASGLNNGSDWANAWINIQTAFDTAAAGDTVYCRGTQTLAVSIDVDMNSGDWTNGYIKFIGCNAAGAVNGTRFVLDASMTAPYCLNIAAGMNYFSMENIEFKNAVSHGVNANGNSSQHWFWNNCSFHENGGNGGNFYRNNDAFFIRCAFYNNSVDGVTAGFSQRFLFCSFHDNSQAGINGYVGRNNNFTGCLIIDNTVSGVHRSEDREMYLQCVIDGNGSTGFDGEDSPGQRYLIGCRVTNHTGAGADLKGHTLIHGWNYFQDNGVNIQNVTVDDIEIRVNGVGTDMENQGDVNQGYTSISTGSKDFNLRPDATLRRTAIPIPRN